MPPPFVLKGSEQPATFAVDLVDILPRVSRSAEQILKDKKTQARVSQCAGSALRKKHFRARGYWLPVLHE